MSVKGSSQEPRAEAPEVSNVLPLSLRPAKLKRTADDSSASGKIKTHKKKKKKKKKKSENSRPKDDQALDLEKGVNTAIGNLDSQLLADYVAQKTKRFDDNLTMVELEEKHIPGIFIFNRSKIA